MVDGRFHLRQYLGGSGHSAVFLTERGDKFQKAAIKLVPADPARTQLLLSRWERCAKLSHDHLIRLFEMGRCQLGDMALCYVVMEYGEEDLSQILPQRALTPPEATEMLRQVVDAIAYLHDEGFVHGHIKPSNILALGDQIKVSSDALCSMGDPCDSTASPGIYDAPELAANGISSAADVWSLGVTLIESLTQHPSGWEMTQGEPILRQTLPAPFQEIVRHCLQSAPQRRWQTAAIASALKPTPVRIQESVPANTRKSNLAGRLALPIIAAIVILAVFAGIKLRNRDAEAPAQESPLHSMNEEQTAATAPAAPPLVSSEAVTTSSHAREVEGPVLQEVLPKVSPSARRTIQGTVRVRVKANVDASGNVTGTKLESPGPSQYFARLSTEAAHKWKFAPVQVNGQNVASEWILRFEFGRTLTRAIPQRTRP